jgi:hypothetical protein
MMDAIELPLENIRLDGGTQVRVEIDEPTVQRYREVISDGGTLDPIQVLHDGSEYWPWDGFHRIHATRGAGGHTILAHIGSGTRKDAIRKALSANKKHGKPLTAADRMNAVKIALREFSELSDGVIADEIGASPRSVAKYRAAGSATPQNAESTLRTGKDGRTINVENIGKTTAPAAGPINSDDIPFDVPANQPGAPARPVDEVGNVLVSQKMIEEFGRRDEITALMQSISEIKTTVAQAIERQDPLFLSLNSSAFDAGCTNLYRRLSTLRPYAVCPYCSGDGCKSCHMRGWVGREVYDAAPRDAK